MKKLKVISLFSGAGGLDLGLKDVGFEIIGSAEIMPEAVQTHNLNFKLKSNVVDLLNEKDYIEFINKFKNEKIDLLTGGFPCQGFSMAGKRNINDPRNFLYKKIVDVLNDLKIDNFLLENVPGILSINKGKSFKEIENYFNKNGYYFKYVVLKAVNFGVPQKRKRVFFIGTNKINELNKIEKIINKLKKHIQIETYLTLTTKICLQDLENAKENKYYNHIFTKHSSKVLEKIKKLKVGEAISPKYNNSPKKIDYNKPVHTIQGSNLHIHPVKNRFLTIRELARLQTFPDHFIFKGSKKSQQLQVGNAVPVLLAYTVGLYLLYLFKGKKNE